MPPTECILTEVKGNVRILEDLSFKFVTGSALISYKTMNNRKWVVENEIFFLCSVSPPFPIELGHQRRKKQQV